MSLIADSLKKANKARSEREVFPHTGNPLALKKTSRGLGLPTIAKITFLVALPGMVLIYLVQSGVFSGKQILSNDRSLSKVSEPAQEISESASLHSELQNRNLVTSPPLVEKIPRKNKPVTPMAVTKSPQSERPNVIQSPAPDVKKIVVEKAPAKAVVPQEKIAPPKIIPPSQSAQVKSAEMVLAPEEIVVPTAPTQPVMMAEVAEAKPFVPALSK